MRTQARLSRSLLALMTAGLLLPAPLAAQETSEESALVADLQAIADRLPDPSGDDAAGLRELLGPPDAFLIAFEPLADGSSSRREQWIYYDLATAFELADGALLADRPLEAETGLLVLPGGYDPADFTAGATWPSLADVLDDAAGFEAVPLDAGYGIDATIYVGDFLQLAFDEDGGLFYVEAVPLSAGLPDEEPAS